MVKLAFWDTVNSAYRFVFTHPLTIVRTGWAYLVINGVNFSFRNGGPHRPLSLAVLAFAVTVLVIAASIAWHVAFLRTILLGEHSWTAALQFRRRHWRIVGVTLLLMLILVPAAAVAVVVGVVAAHLGGAALVAGIVVIVAAAVAFIVAVTRLYLIAPAIATDDPAKAIRAAWRRGRRNTPRLFFGWLLMVLPAVIVTAIGGGIVAVIFVAMHGPESAGAWIAQLGFVGRTALGLAQAAVQLVVGAFGAAFNALAYRQLAVNWKPPPALAAAQFET
ncbi:MAG: hypothetical protein KGL11_01285 [Alphaproteobacteria bacterium]|nr:hypothetical protein [Alphaproteobacteria bacterium]